MSAEPQPAVNPSEPKGGIFERLIGFVLEQPLLVYLAVALVVGLGVVVAPFDFGLPISRSPVAVDAIPDIGENQQIVMVEWPGRSPEDVDNQVTRPLTVALMGTPGVRTIRSFSSLGVSMIYVLFEEGAEFYWTRARIVEKLASLPAGLLPEGTSAQLGPDATALGQIFWYTLEGRDPQGNPVGGWDLHELRTIQDFQVRYALAAAQGVSEVASIGGFVRELQVDVDPAAMRAWGITLEQVQAAVRDANAEVGAGTTEINGVEYLVRGVGFVRDLEALRETVVATVGGVPVRIKDVATVADGPALRGGALDTGGVETVGGVVVSRFGANPAQVIGNVKVAIEEVQQGLPSRVLEDGTVSQVTIVPFYDRSGLIEATLGTLEAALQQQILITLLVVMVLMLHLRSSFLIASLLPVAVLITFVAMKQSDVTANVVSLAGIAIAIGTMVDTGIVVVENIVRRLDQAAPGADRFQVVRSATIEVAGAVLTAVATTVVSFIPVFFLDGPEGKLFRPLAFTKTYAVLASVILALTVLPPLAWLFIGRWKRRPNRWARLGAILLNVVAVAAITVLLARSWMPLSASVSESRNLLFVLIVVGGLLGSFWIFQWVYPRVLRWVLLNKLVFSLFPLSVVVFGITAWLGFGSLFQWMPDSVHQSRVGQWMHHELPGFGREFMPQLDEGAFLYMPTTMPHASIAEVLDMVAELDALIESIPEVSSAVGKIGRAESALDPAPLSMIETVIHYESEYVMRPDGQRARFLVDEQGVHLRDDAGQLIPDPAGRPYRNWRPEFRTQQDIWDEIVRVANVPGLTSAPLLQPISARIVMLESGIQAPMAIRLRGPSLEALGQAGERLEAWLREHPLVNHGAVNADRPVGKPYIEIHPNREALARHGVSMAAVQEVIGAAIGGGYTGETIEGIERYPIRVRYPRELRDSPEAMAQVLVARSTGASIPLGVLADIRYRRGPDTIRSEDTALVSYVMFDGLAGVAEVAVIDSVREMLSAAIDSGEVVLGEGVSYSFAGSYQNAMHAEARLKVLVPLVILTVFMLLYLQFRSISVSLMVFSGIAVALSGGLVLIWLYGQPGFLDFSMLGMNLREVFQVMPVNMSVAVWVGFIALFGIATDDGVVTATYLRQRFAEDAPLTIQEVHERVVAAGTQRIRACLMTTATTVLALLPVLTSYGTGADVMIPMALPALGGMAFELITLFVVPLLFATTQEFRVHWRTRGSNSQPEGSLPNSPEQETS